MTFLRTLDPKLVYTLLAGAVSYAVLELGLDLDANAQAAITGVLAALVGYGASNDGTVLRTPQADGNPVMPDVELDDTP